MKKLAICLTAPLLLVSALSYAAPGPQSDDHPNFEHHMHGGMHPPHPMPVYAVTETTSTPAETLKSLVAQVSQVDAGKYQVKIEVLPLPPKPEKPAGAH